MKIENCLVRACFVMKDEREIQFAFDDLNGAQEFIKTWEESKYVKSHKIIESNASVSSNS